MKPFLENLHISEKISKYQHQDDADTWIIWRGFESSISKVFQKTIKKTAETDGKHKAFAKKQNILTNEYFRSKNTMSKIKFTGLMH